MIFFRRLLFASCIIPQNDGTEDKQEWTAKKVNVDKPNCEH